MLILISWSLSLILDGRNSLYLWTERTELIITRYNSDKSNIILMILPVVISLNTYTEWHWTIQWLTTHYYSRLTISRVFTCFVHFAFTNYGYNLGLKVDKYKTAKSGFIGVQWQSGQYVRPIRQNLNHRFFNIIVHVSAESIKMLLNSAEMSIFTIYNHDIEFVEL